METKEKIATAFLSMLQPDTDKIVKPVITKVVSSIPVDLFLYVTISLLGLKQGGSYRLYIDILHNGESCIKHYENPYGEDDEEFIADNGDLPENQVSATFNASFPEVKIPDVGIYEIKVSLRNKDKDVLDENSYYFDIIKEAIDE